MSQKPKYKELNKNIPRKFLNRWAGIVTLINKVKHKTTTIKCKKGRHCLILKTKSLNEDIISMNIYVTNNTAFLFVRQNLRDDRRHRQSKTNRRL